ncbi:MoaD/ThiS family protein [Kitasatospora sp. LaBMicrA B282]|uniref:MoaD/ThiS family protein n=1 Tax=Kitasatospora sp. LaBMicrA B282 TaxID=3420949 RepID=UPI003D1171AA
MPETTPNAAPTLTAPAVTVHLPAAFHTLTGGRRQIPAAGDSIREVLHVLDRDCPGVLDRIVDQQGSMKRYVNVYRNDTDIRGDDGLETKVADRDVIWIVPAVAGGSGAAPTRES